MLAQEAMAAEEEEEEVEEGVQDRLAAEENEAGSGSEGDADDKGSGEWHGMDEECFVTVCCSAMCSLLWQAQQVLPRENAAELWKA